MSIYYHNIEALTQAQAELSVSLALIKENIGDCETVRKW